MSRLSRGSVVVLLVVVVTEELVLGLTKPASRSWEEDYDALLLPVLEQDLPCYILFRLDSSNSLGHEWIFIAWSPDHSPVNTDIHVNTTKQTLQGVAFPLDGEAMNALQKFKDKKLSYVQLMINFEKELIVLSSTESTEVKDLPKRIPKDAARYHFFRFKHSHEGDYLESAVFIYSMPGYSCGIRERMLYSSCKNPLLDMVESKLQMEVEKKMEIDNGEDLTADFLYDEVHPKQHAHKQAFAKPRGPQGRRGERRITRRPGDGQQDDD